MGELRIAGHLIRAKIRGEAQYPLSMLSHFIAQLLIVALDLVAIWVIFQRVSALGGWTRGQVLGLYAISGTAFGIGDVFVGSIERTTEYVRLGTFDKFLVRPAGTLVQLLANEFEIRRVGRAAQPLVALVIVCATVPIRWTPAHVLLLIEMLVSALALSSSLWIVTSAAAFWLPSTQEFANAFTYGGQYASQYPIGIMGEWMRRLMLSVIPLGLVAYVPSIEFFGVADPFHVPTWASYTAPLVAIPAVLLARLTWRAGNRHYRSTGS